jgi:hypothetical protein
MKAKGHRDPGDILDSHRALMTVNEVADLVNVNRIGTHKKAPWRVRVEDVEAWAARNPVLSCAGAQPGGEWRARCPAGQ